jgi:hypothetical protein
MIDRRRIQCSEEFFIIWLRNYQNEESDIIDASY